MSCPQICDVSFIPVRSLDCLWSSQLAVRRRWTLISQTSSFEHLPRSFRAVGQGERYDLIVSREFDLHAKLVSAGRPAVGHRQGRRTLSRMTNGPLTPPIVLYVMRGFTEAIRGSSSTEGILAGGNARIKFAPSSLAKPELRGQ